MDRNGTIWKKILGLKGLASVGFSDIIGGGMGAFFGFILHLQYKQTNMERLVIF